MCKSLLVFHFNYIAIYRLTSRDNTVSCRNSAKGWSSLVIYTCSFQCTLREANGSDQWVTTSAVLCRGGWAATNFVVCCCSDDNGCVCKLHQIDPHICNSHPFVYILSTPTVHNFSGIDLHQSSPLIIHKLRPSKTMTVITTSEVTTYSGIEMCLVLLSASLYFSKRGAYWDRLCRDVVGWLSRACTVAKRCILGL